MDYQTERNVDRIREFDPNTRSKVKEYVYATYCPTRMGSPFKIHRFKNHATNALNANVVGGLYLWEDSRWVLISIKVHGKEYL